MKNEDTSSTPPENVEQVAVEEVSAEDVKDFLNMDEGEAPGEYFDLSDNEGVVVAPEPEEKEQRDPEFPADQTYSPKNATKDAVLEWVLNSADLSDLDITDLDKSEFMRAALNNKPVTMTVRVLRDVSVECRSLSDYEVDVLYHTLNRDQEEQGKQMEQVTFFTLMQRYGTCMQITRLDGVAVPYSEFHREPALPLFEALQKDSDALREAAAARADDSSVRTTLLRTALRIFSCKMKICTEKMAKADFWTPVDAG